MKSRLSFYGLLALVICPAFIYLLFLLAYNWYIGDYPGLRLVVEDMVSRNSRWFTWGACAGGFGLLIGILMAIMLLIAPSDKVFFDDMFEGFLSITVKDKAFPSARGIVLFFALVVIGFLAISTDWRSGLRNGLEFIGVIVWVVSMVASFILIPVLLVDVFVNGLIGFVVNRLLKGEDT
jgi:hypothetical protein